MTIAIIGPGAIGATVAAHLARVGHAVTLAARAPLDRLVIATPDGAIEARPTIATDPDAARPADWVLVCTKTYHDSAAWLAALAGAATRVAVLQNGVEHRARFAAIVPPERLVPVIVDIPAERTAPGRVTQHRHGTLLAPDDDAGRAFAGLFTGTPILASATPDWTTAAWRKLCINAAGLALTLIDRPFGASAHLGVAAAVHALATECAAVGRLEGAVLPADMADEIVAYYRAQAPTLRNSLHNDLLAGKPLELDARNGVVVRLGERHGVPTPVSRAMIGLVEGLAAGCQPTSSTILPRTPPPSCRA